MNRETNRGKDAQRGVKGPAHVSDQHIKLGFRYFYRPQLHPLFRRFSYAKFQNTGGRERRYPGIALESRRQGMAAVLSIEDTDKCNQRRSCEKNK